jgi:3-isopropylmalate/(R)-2-methylmalate dehydratase large subunit
MTVVCGDSHTSTHGAFAALAFGIGTSEVEHVLATQCLIMKKAKSMLVRVDRYLPPGVTAKDIALAVIGKIGTAGGTGHAIEFSGSAIRALSMEARMTVCNMSIEAGARAGMVAVGRQDDRLSRGRPFSPGAELWDRADCALARARERRRRALRHRRRARRVDALPAGDVGHVAGNGGAGRRPRAGPRSGKGLPDVATASSGRLRTWGLAPNTAITDIGIDKVFIGSCTNSRIEDLRDAAIVARGRRVAKSVKAGDGGPGLRPREGGRRARGLDRVFRDAGFEWREPGCSMCLAMNDDRLEPGERCASTSNRNFEGRQGAGGRTHLVSPAMAAAAAIAGHFVDVRRLV